ncbi:membrane-bound serine protease (ClpP class) [Caloramator quimbayensis]|uniref:Membrane-bound serine protease (ClpP class) n=1 Tax=Caloramator quimbayensis TaxID=1147123 RepID=A0A1T4X8H4_9CLOT|nr:hypothetical protein [Caloramator quimbayensis]SKA85893.1 membrane-bound serine protease (ClpP class) [Caloramator quimbayensis]
MKKRTLLNLFNIFLFLIFFIINHKAVASDKGVYIIPIKGEIGPAVSAFVSNQFKTAKDLNCEIVILDLDTSKGRLKDAIKIQEIIINNRKSFKIYSYIKSKTESAGVIIALSSHKIYMAKDATIGNAFLLSTNNYNISLWNSILKNQAESTGRKGDIALSMADYSTSIPNLKIKGELLNLSAKKAKEFGYCDGVVNNMDELINSVYRGKRIFYAQKDIKVKLSEIISNPYYAMLLLLFGITFVLLESSIKSYKILGTLGVLGISIYFTGSILSGNTVWWTFVLFIAGFILLSVKNYYKKYKFIGTFGFVCLCTSILFSRDLRQGIIFLSASILVYIIDSYIIIKYINESELLTNIIFKLRRKKLIN